MRELGEAPETEGAAAAGDDAGDDAFASGLRRHRLAAGLTQEALAGRAGAGVRTIQGLERGEARPGRGTLRRLVAALGLEGAARARFEAAGRPAARPPAPPRRPGPSGRPSRRAP